MILTANIGMEMMNPPHSRQNSEEDTEIQKDSKNAENLLDAKTIFKYNIIKKKNPNVNVVTELIN